MRASKRHELVASLARSIVRTVAPEELAFFGPVADAYGRDPDRVLAGRRRPDEVLGSGLDTFVALVSPVALAVATSTYHHLLDRTGEELSRRGRDRLRTVLRRRRRDPAEPAGEPDAVPQEPGTTDPEAAAVAFDEEQLAEVGAAAGAQARALGLDDEQADLLVAALLANLRRE